ncbi:MAG: hypothetical protein ABII90_05105 [Bacteroidota bacterium]
MKYERNLGERLLQFAVDVILYLRTNASLPLSSTNYLPYYFFLSPLCNLRFVI